MKKQKLTARQKESKRINRKRAVRQWWKATSRRVIVICFIFSVSCAAWLWHSHSASIITANAETGFWQETARLGFKVETIYLEGRKYTSLADVTTAMGVASGTPIFSVSLNEMRDRLQAIPRVKYAEVTRVLPDQLHIRIVEREPIAIWQSNGKLHLIDDEGIAMDYVDPAQYKNLLLVVGEDAPIHTHELLTMMASEPEIYKEVAAVLRIGERRWNIRFKNGIELKLPEKNASQAWESFATIEREDHILERSIRSVDMRLPDRIFIKTAPQDASPVKETGSET